MMIALVLESGRFKLVSGEYKGYVPRMGAAPPPERGSELPA